MKHALRALALLLVAACFGLPTAYANVIISGTRVIFPAQSAQATVRLTNDNTQPVLVEAWIDAGNPKATPNTVHTPFLITPPVFRMDAHKDQNLRILFVQGKQPLPTNHESLFWLNVLEIPPKPTGELAGKNVLQFAIRSRIKLFYRPTGLKISEGDAQGKLTWTPADGSKGDVTLAAHNPTPYYITVIGFEFTVNGKRQKFRTTGMVAPFSTAALAVQGLKQAPAAGTSFDYVTINDGGAAITNPGKVQQ